MQQLYNVVDKPAVPVSLPPELTAPDGALRELPPNPTSHHLVAAIVEAFSLTKRYIDDLLSAMNPLWPYLTYNTQSLGDVRGIYPDTLNFKNATPDRIGMQPLPFLDIHVTPTREPSGRIRLHSLLYDKRREPAFAALGLKRFTHASSVLSKGCKLNIITSRYHVMRTIISLASNFCLETARMMYDFEQRGYNMRHMWSKLCFLLSTYPCYKPARWQRLLRRVRQDYDARRFLR